MPEIANQSWPLESFLDSLIVELDKAQDTLALKGITRKLTYMVRDFALDLFVVPRYDGDRVFFTTARPGETNASKLSLQLGSISDRQIRESSRDPFAADDVAIDNIEGLDKSVRDSLKKVGVRSAQDVERMKERNVDVDSVVRTKSGGQTVDYSSLARLINQARRRKTAPRVSAVSLVNEDGQPTLVVDGENLVQPTPAKSTAFEAGQSGTFPAAVLGSTMLKILSADEHQVRLAVPHQSVPTKAETLRIALDAYALMTMQIVP